MNNRNQLGAACRFLPVTGGWESALNLQERNWFLQAIREVVTLLDPPVLPFSLEALLPATSSTSAENSLAAADILPADALPRQDAPLNQAPTGEGRFLPVQNGNDLGQNNPALDRLLPVAALDPHLDQEIRQLTEQQLRKMKTDRLLILAEELEHPSGGTQRIRVRWGEELLWLAGINDVRLAISGSLLSGGPPGCGTPESPIKTQPFILNLGTENPGIASDTYQVQSSFYTWLGGWQDSLLSAIDQWPAPSYPRKSG